MNTNQTFYWEVEDYSGQVISLMEEGRKIYSQKLTKKQVENITGKSLIVCPANENPQIIVGAKVEENGTKFLDCRKSLRGNTKRYYLIN